MTLGLGVNNLSIDNYSIWTEASQSLLDQATFFSKAWRILGGKSSNHEATIRQFDGRVTASALLFATMIPHVQLISARTIDDGWSM